jgi:hypothetical protein
MLQSYKYELQKPLTLGPHTRITFYRKMLIKLDKVCFLIEGNLAQFAETAMKRTNSVLFKVNIYLLHNLT